jgi:zinc transport system substrate-binding protein
MKKIRIAFLLFCVAGALILTGCEGWPAATRPHNSKPVVYCTIYPLYDFTVKIGGDKVDVNNMVPGGVEPHEWEPGPQMLASLSKADLLIYNGFGMEPWLDKIAASLGGELVLLNASEGIKPLQGYEGHDHHEDDDDHHEDDDDHYDEEGLPDPHVWLDPLLALYQAEQIAAALITLDPANEEYYLERLSVFRQEVLALDDAYRQAFAFAKKRVFVVTHLSFAYLAERYGLVQLGIAGLSPHTEPSPAQMKELVDTARKHEIRHIFREPLATSRLATVLAGEIDAEILSLNPLEGLTAEEAAAGADYFSVMFWNLEQLKTAMLE